MAKATESKTERMAKVVEKSAKVTPLPQNQINERAQKAILEAVAKAEDQKAVKAEDQKTTGTGDTPKKKRKFSAVHLAWKAQPELPLTGKIKMLVKGNPKRAASKSAARFDLHEDGFTVQQYIDKCKKAGISEKLAMEDVKWDVTKKFIEVR
jgi:predicted transposase YdaD